MVFEVQVATEILCLCPIHSRVGAWEKMRQKISAQDLLLIVDG